MKKIALTLLSLGLVFANVSNASVITLGILPALNQDFANRMDANCMNNYGRAGEIMACIGQWILDEDIKSVLNSLESAGVLKELESKRQLGGNLQLEIPDALIVKSGEAKIQEALKVYLEVTAR